MGSSGVTRREDEFLERSKRAEEDSLLTDLFKEAGVDAPVDPLIENRSRINRMKLTWLHLLLMLDSPACWIRRGNPVRFKIDGPEGTILDYDDIIVTDSPDVHHKSLYAAAKAAINRGGADGWTQTFPINLDDPTARLVPIAEVFRSSWPVMGVPVEVLLDEHRLAERLWKEGRITEAEYQRVIAPPRKAKPASKGTAKTKKSGKIAVEESDTDSTGGKR